MLRDADRAGSITTLDFDYDNLEAWVSTDDASHYDLDELKQGEEHIERFENSHSCTIEIFRRTERNNHEW